MSPAQRQAVINSLWPPQGKPGLGVWAVLDCARDPAIYLALLASRLEFRCLYSGKLPRELELVAPHLVELTPDNRLTAQWLDQGWGQSWGVFLKIADPSNLRHHLRKFLKVRDDAGRKLLFRYYDPRVLRVFLPTCRSDELQQLFGPLDSFWVESEGGAALVDYRHDRGRLDENRLALPLQAVS